MGMPLYALKDYKKVIFRFLYFECFIIRFIHTFSFLSFLRNCLAIPVVKKAAICSRGKIVCLHLNECFMYILPSTSNAFQYSKILPMLLITYNNWCCKYIVFMAMRGKLPTENIPRGFSTQTQNICGQIFDFVEN